MRARRAQGTDFAAYMTALVMLSASGFAVATGDALGPDHDTPTVPVAAAPEPVGASLSFAGEDPIITGSIDHIFETETFIGPNRLVKQDRQRPQIDIASFAEGFDAVRTRLAALRSASPELSVIELVAETRAEEGLPTEEEERVQVAAVNPALATSRALAAIDGATGTTAAHDPSIPIPATVPEALAYARDNEPATDWTSTARYSERERWCLATGIYYEARGEPYRGQVAVAQVIMNRVGHHLYPDTICGVVYQNAHLRNRCQFSFACDGRPERMADSRARQVAEEIVEEVLSEAIYLAEVGDSTHYHANYVYPHWASRMDRVARIGLHIFYRFKPGWRYG